jgi:signal transduction histidine kinase
MTKKSLLLFCCLYLGGRALADTPQSHWVDSLRQVLATTKTDKNRVLLLNTLAEHIVNDLRYADTPQVYIQEALALATQLGDQPGKAEAHRLYGSYLAGKRQYAQALGEFAAAEQIAAEIDQPALQGRIVASRGLMQDIRSNLATSLANYLWAIELFEKAGDQSNLAHTQGLVGLVYQKQGNHADALRYLKRSLQTYEQVGDRNGVAEAHRRIGALYLAQGQDSQALAQLEGAERLARSPRVESWVLAGILRSLAMLNAKLGKYPAAEAQLQEVLAMRGLPQYDFFLMNDLTDLARVYRQLGRPQEAMRLASQSNELATQMNNQAGRLNNYAVIAGAWADLANYPKAYEYQQKYLLLKDSAHSLEREREVAQVKAEYQSERQQLRIDQNERIIQQNERIRNVLIATVLTITTLVVFLYRRNVQNNRLNQRLTQKNEQAARQNEEIVAQRDILRLMADDVERLRQEAQSKAEMLAVANHELEHRNQEIAAQAGQLTQVNNSLEAAIRARTQELELLVDNLTQQKNDLEQFSFIVSHNLRAPVANILGLVNVLDRDQPGTPTNLEVFDHLEKTTLNLDAVIRDLNQILSIRNNLGKLKERIDLPQLVGDLLKGIEADIREANASIATEWHSVKYIFSLRSYVYSILLNLVSNAIKYRHPLRPPVVTLSADWLPDGCLCLTVADNGLGVDLKGNPEKIFGLYKRMHDHVEGKGLGLYLVKTQAQALGGRVEVASQPGEGTTFKVFLKASEPA